MIYSVEYHFTEATFDASWKGKKKDCPCPKEIPGVTVFADSSKQQEDQQRKGFLIQMCSDETLQGTKRSSGW